MKLSRVLKELNSSKDIENFLVDLCTPSEIEAMEERWEVAKLLYEGCLLYTSPSPRDATLSRMPSSA